MTATLPEGRYPAHTGPSGIRGALSPRLRILFVAVVLILGLGVAYVGYLKFAVKPIEGTQLSFDIVDDSTMSIRFSVTRADPSEPAVCIIRARSRDGSETGRREVYIAPSSGTVDLTSEVRTSSAPAVGDVYGCSLDVPGYLLAR